MARAISIRPSERRPYVLPSDRALPEHEQTEFLLRALTSEEQLKLQNLVRVGDGSSGTGDVVWLACKMGIAGVSESKPLRDEHGEPVPFETGRDGKVKDSFLHRISHVDLNGLAAAIRTGASMDEEAVEKPAPSHDSQPEGSDG